MGVTNALLFNCGNLTSNSAGLKMIFCHPNCTMNVLLRFFRTPSLVVVVVLRHGNVAVGDKRMTFDTICRLIKKNMPWVECQLSFVKEQQWVKSWP